jgi:molybdopterin/thiamine biosynthesis adenylyltransferase
MRNVLIIGAGGIGSFLIPLLDKTGLYKLTVYDPDIVETKNITYQNFSSDDVDKHKVASMAERFNSVDAQPYPILTSQQLNGYDLVVCCADNLTVRRTLYNSTVKWLDLRAQGRNATLVSYREKPELRTELTNGPDGSFSCQGDAWDGATKDVHFMQVAIAGIGAEWVQRWFNEEDVFTHRLIAG